TCSYDTPTWTYDCTCAGPSKNKEWICCPEVDLKACPGTQPTDGDACCPGGSCGYDFSGKPGVGGATCSCFGNRWSCLYPQPDHGAPHDGGTPDGWVDFDLASPPDAGSD